MLDPKKVRLGICPIGWSNDDMWDLGDENTFQQCISEMKLAGFDGCEVGHKYPEDKTVLKQACWTLRNMTHRLPSWFSSFLVDKPYEEVEAEFIKELDLPVGYVGATAINVSEQSGSIQGQLDTPVLRRQEARSDRRGVGSLHHRPEQAGQAVHGEVRHPHLLPSSHGHRMPDRRGD